MYTTKAWILKMGAEHDPGPGQLELGTVSFGALADDEVLVEPLYASWEGNSYHALTRQPIDVCRVRGEAEVVLGNAGVVRVLRPGPGVTDLREGDVCLLQGNYKPDRFGYLENGGAFGYDAKGTVGLLAQKTKIRAHCLVPLPRATRHSWAQWAAFSIRYVTAWANWRVAYGTWRLQVTEDDQRWPYVWGWGGGTSFAELTLARRFGAQAAMIASQPGRLALAETHGLRPVDRRRFPDLSLDERRLGEPGYEDRYRASEKAFLQLVKQSTDGLGASIFVDYVGAPVLRATLRALAREGVLTTAGWREGMRLSLIRSLECIQRHQHVHTHYARRTEVVEAMAYGERTGWMPPLDEERPWAFDAVPALVDDYAAGHIESYFPLVKVNP
jgi:NADPH:quinone reductase-like Zn-dependent oxidoreductase